MTGPQSPLLTPAEVAFLFRADIKTVTRWAKNGKLASVRTPGGHRRYFRAQVDALLRGEPLTAQQVTALQAQFGAQP